MTSADPLQHTAAILAAMFSFTPFVLGGTKHGKVRLQTERAAAPQKAVFTGEVLLGGNPIPGMTISVRSETGTAQHITTTDVHGEFTLASLDDGLYRVDVMLEGLTPVVIEHLQLKANEVTKARFTVKINVPYEEITVGGGAIDPLSNGVSTTFTQSFTNDLPH
jgi:hypothetical protein